MGLATFKRGQRIKLDGVCFDLTGMLPTGNWQLAEVDTGLRDEKNPDELWQAFFERRLRFENIDTETSKSKQMLEKLSPAAQEMAHDCNSNNLTEAAHRDEYVREIMKSRGLCPLTDIIHKTWEKLRWPVKEPSLRTVQYWCSKERTASDPINALVEKHYLKGNGRSRYPSEILELADEVIQNDYLKISPRITTAAAAAKLAALVRKENTNRPPSERLPIPGRSVIASRIALVPEYERIAKRFGLDAARVAMRIALGGVETEKALQRCELDHTLLSIVVLDDDFMPWGRPSASVCLDAHTRAVTGFCIGAEVPSIVSVARAIECSVMPKIELLKNFPDLKSRWDCYGVHESYILDNGLEEHATALRHAASELGGSTIEFCPRKAPWFKPHIERFFRAHDMDLLKTLPGFTGENIAVRPAFNPKKDMLLTRRTFDKIFMKWLVDIYLRTPQVRLGDISPSEAWKRSITLEEQLVPTRRVSLERLFLRKETDRSLDHEGITFDCLQYNSKDLGALRTQLGAKLTVDIWVSDEDLGYIYVVVPNQDIVVRVPCIDQRYASGLTRWQHKKCKKQLRIRMDEGLQLTLDEAREEITKLIEKDFAELRHARRKNRTRFTTRKVNQSHKNSAPTKTGSSTAMNTQNRLADQALMRGEDEVVPEILIESNHGSDSHDHQ